MAAPAAPAVTAAGKPVLAKYQALTNISVPQRSDNGLLTGQNELYGPGDIVELTEREAANLLATGPRAGRQAPAIRAYKDRGMSLPRILPRQMSGLVRQPATPPAGSDAPRPDPAGSSRIVESGPPPPEITDPVPGSENGAPITLDALDLPPRGVR